MNLTILQNIVAMIGIMGIAGAILMAFGFYISILITTFKDRDYIRFITLVFIGMFLLSYLFLKITGAFIN